MRPRSAHLSRPLAIFRHGCPAIWPRLVLPAPRIDHGLNGEDVALLQFTHAQVWVASQARSNWLRAGPWTQEWALGFRVGQCVQSSM